MKFSPQHCFVNISVELQCLINFPVSSKNSTRMKKTMIDLNYFVGRGNKFVFLSLSLSLSSVNLPFCKRISMSNPMGKFIGSYTKQWWTLFKINVRRQNETFPYTQDQLLRTILYCKCKSCSLSLSNPQTHHGDEIKCQVEES